MRILSLALILSAVAAAPALAQQGAPSAQRAGLRVLTWPGKVQPQAPRHAPPPAAMAAAPVAVQRPADPAWTPAYRPVAHRSSHMLGEVTPAQQSAIDAQRAQDRAAAEQAKALVEAEKLKQTAQAQGPAPAPSPALPTSIYAAPPPAQAQQYQAAPAADGSRMAMAAGYDQKARFYSVHRQFGERPDPIALSPQFLATPSADLADPPPPPAPRILPGQNATAAQQTAARVAARDSSSSD